MFRVVGAGDRFLCPGRVTFLGAVVGGAVTGAGGVVGGDVLLVGGDRCGRAPRPNSVINPGAGQSD